MKLEGSYNLYQNSFTRFNSVSVLYSLWSDAHLICIVTPNLYWFPVLAKEPFTTTWISDMSIKLKINHAVKLREKLKISAQYWEDIYSTLSQILIMYVIEIYMIVQILFILSFRCSTSHVKIINDEVYNCCCCNCWRLKNIFIRWRNTMASKINIKLANSPTFK